MALHASRAIVLYAPGRMSSADKSASAYTRQLRARAMATYHANAPTGREAGTRATFDASSYAIRVLGGTATTSTGPNGAQTTTDGCGCACTGDIVITLGDWSGYEDYSERTISWTPVSGATSYTVTTDSVYYSISPSTLSGTSTTMTALPGWSSEPIITVTANCGATGTITSGMPCFLAGSLVRMADGSDKVIEDVQVGDIVVGAFGEHNEVLALHRPLLGLAKMCKINDEHSTTNHHPHISVDKQFYCGNPELVSTATYGRTHIVYDATGAAVERMLHGLLPERIKQLVVGVDLKTIEGSRAVRELEVYEMPEDTQLYNLVVAGSHTYHVDGYAVTGWPREDDFDYDAWLPR